MSPPTALPSDVTPPNISFLKFARLKSPENIDLTVSITFLKVSVRKVKTAKLLKNLAAEGDLFCL